MVFVDFPKRDFFFFTPTLFLTLTLTIALVFILALTLIAGTADISRLCPVFVRRRSSGTGPTMDTILHN